MRILMLEPGPFFSVRDVHEGWREAFIGLGHEVASLNLGDRLGFYSLAGRVKKDSGEFVRMVNEEGAVRLASKGVEAACFEFWPDMCFVTSCFYLPADTLDMIRARGIKVVIAHLESPYEDDIQAIRAEHADLNFLNDPTNLDRFPPGTLYMPHAYRPSLHRPGTAQPDLASEFCFVGTGYPSRIETLEAVDWTGMDVALAGNWQALDAESPLRKLVAHDIEQCLDNVDAVALYQSSLTSANLYRVEAERPELSQGWAVGPREVEMAACGLWFARQSRGESDALFPVLPTFSTPEELGEQVRWALAHPDERETAAQQARNAVMDRTFAQNAPALLAAFDKL